MNKLIGCFCFRFFPIGSKELALKFMTLKIIYRWFETEVLDPKLVETEEENNNITRFKERVYNE